MNSKKIKLLIKILIPVIIVGACVGVEKVLSTQRDKVLNKVVVATNDNTNVNENLVIEVQGKQTYGDVSGLYRNFGFLNDDEALVAIGLNKEEYKRKYPNEIDPNNENLANQSTNDLCGKMYVYNLKDFTKRSLDIDALNVCSDLLPGANKYAYLSGNKMSISDLNNKSQAGEIETSNFDSNTNFIKEASDCMSVWSKDWSSLINYGDGNLNVYNVKEKSLKKFKIDKDNRHISQTPSYYSENGEDIYYVGVKYDDDGDKTQGIYKININDKDEKIEEVYNLPTNYEDGDKSEQSMMCGYDVLEGGKKIIFSGIIKGVSGTYIYDVNNDNIYNVIPAETKSELGRYSHRIWVSPDKGKIVYMDLVKEGEKEKWNLYAARINGNSLTERVCIYEDIKLCGFDITWSADSKKILFFTTDSYSGEGYQRFANKNEINIITFK